MNELLPLYTLIGLSCVAQQPTTVPIVVIPKEEIEIIDKEDSRETSLKNQAEEDADLIANTLERKIKENRNAKMAQGYLSFSTKESDYLLSYTFDPREYCVDGSKKPAFKGNLALSMTENKKKSENSILFERNSLFYTNNVVFISKDFEQNQYKLFSKAQKFYAAMLHCVAENLKRPFEIGDLYLVEPNKDEDTCFIEEKMIQKFHSVVNVDPKNIKSYLSPKYIPSYPCDKI